MNNQDIIGEEGKADLLVWMAAATHMQWGQFLM